MAPTKKTKEEREAIRKKKEEEARLAEGAVERLGCLRSLLLVLRRHILYNYLLRRFCSATPATNTTCRP